MMQANVDSVDIIVRGKGGHGAAPHTTLDPIPVAARIVLDLQTIKSRSLDPLDQAVVTVGSIHGGTKHNIIPDEVRLQLTIRTLRDDVRKTVLEGIERISRAAALSARAPEPIVRIDAHSFTPALKNDPELTRRMVQLFRSKFGEEKVVERRMSLGGEDFSRFVNAGVTGFYYHLGTADPKWVESGRSGGRPPPVTHSSTYYPIPEPTIRTGVLSMSTAVLELLARP
jgi:hippurate hydrolase